LVAVAAGPGFDAGVESLPAAKIEVADAEVGAITKLKGLVESGKKLGFYVVKDARHWRIKGNRVCCRV
jgi:hypothetical protein